MMRRKSGIWRWRNLVAAGMVGVLACVQGEVVWAQTPGVTDEQVVAAMKKGADFLLKAKNVDNWEFPEVKWHMGPNEERGGVTALVLYSLLHAGQSLQDEPEYQAKLHWRSTEISPAVAWLSKQDITETYAAGLRASALTLITKLPDGKPGEGPPAALERDKNYVLNSMGLYGGYDYSYGGASKAAGTFWTTWETYFLAKMTGDKTAMDAAKALLTTHINYRRGSFGGVEGAFRQLVEQLQLKLKTADARETAKLQRELKEVQEFYDHELPKPGEDFAASYAETKANLDKLLDAQKRGDISKVTKWDGAQNKNVPATKDDMPKLIADAKAAVDRTEYAYKNNFVATGDLSNGQYGTLGAWALADYGIELPNKYWEVQDRFWRMIQEPDGGWTYYVADNSWKVGQSRGTMTVAGIASLFIAQEFVDTKLHTLPTPDKNIDAGLAWLNKNFKAQAEEYYYLYGVERVGLSSGLKFFGTTDWYKAGAAAILPSQGADGSFRGEYDPVIATAYALLFLARGRNPVAFNKLEYDGPWNARPRDDAYITRWMSKKFEKPINWQVVNLQVSPEEWEDAPVLMITGSVDPKFTKQDVAKLKAFVTAGGMIFSTADAGSVPFTEAMKRYAAAVVDKKYEMRTLPRNHELFSKDMGVEIANPPMLLGMSNGIREVWIHSPQDVGADWQTRKFASKTSFELGSALYLYASGMGSLRSKLQPLTVDAGSGPAARTVAVALLDYAGNADPEPGAWPRMAKLAKAHFHTEVILATAKFADLDAKKYPIAHLTGTTKVTFTEEEVKGLKAYLDAGGILFADVAGGNAEFAESCQELFKAVYPDQALAALPVDHPIYTGSMTDGAKIDGVDFRKYGNFTLHRRVILPALQEIAVNGQTRIVYSAWDICSGFLGTNTWGVMGYAPRSSEALARNILLYAVERGGGPADAGGVGGAKE